MREGSKPAQVTFPTNLLAPTLRVLCPDGSKLGRVYGKVEGVLRDYAESRGTTLGRLLVMHAFDRHGGVARKLAGYVNSLSPSPRRSAERLPFYKREILSNIARLAKELFKLPEEIRARTPSADDLFLQGLPELLLPVLEILPRVGGSGVPLGCESRNTMELTECGLITLSAMAKACSAFRPASLEELFENHSAFIYSELKNATPPSDYARLRSTFTRAVRQLGCRLPNLRKYGVPVKLWPSKLRGEWELFVDIVQGKAVARMLDYDDALLLAKALRRLSPNTLPVYRGVIGMALTVIPYQDDLSFLDLVAVEPLPGPPGVRTRRHNRLVDLYRGSERAKDGAAKCAGFDSASFTIFISAVISVAMRIGLGAYVGDFRSAYRPVNDKRSAEERQAEKKKWLTRKRMDGEIEAGYVEFVRVINSGSYKRKAGRVKAADKDMRRILFFIAFVTLRYIGYRQQCLVNCVLGENIVFNNDGSITFYFDKTKNDAVLLIELNESRREALGLLQDALNLFHRKVYPYIAKRGGDALGRHFFAAPDGKGGFRRFHSASDFSLVFRRGRNEFMNLKSLPPHMRDKLHPHFLRGLCADWMIMDLKMTPPEVAEVMGHDERTLKRSYLNKRRIRDAGAAIDNGLARLRAIRDSQSLQLKLQHISDKLDQSIRLSAEKDLIIREKDLEIVTLRKEGEAKDLLIQQLRCQLAL